MDSNKRTYSRIYRIFSSKINSDGTCTKIAQNGANQPYRDPTRVNGDTVKKARIEEDDIYEIPISQPSSSKSVTRTSNDSSVIEPISDTNLSPRKNTKPEIDEESLRTLEPGKMVNDTIIEYYLNYLMSRTTQLNRDRMHLFSTFFYSKLVSTFKKNDPQTIDKTCTRWNKSVRVFDKDFLVIPICQGLHWLLVIVCFARKCPDHDDPILITEISKAPKQRNFAFPCMLIFDSLGYRYMDTFTLPIRRFLCKRWRHERPQEEPRNFKNRMIFKEYAAMVPRQRNAYDCGIHLLCTFEKFLSQPIDIGIKVCTGHDLRMQWFFETPKKRAEIKRLIESRKD